MQFDMFSIGEKSQNIISNDGEAIYYSDFFDQGYFEALEEEIIWKQDTITLYGKTHKVPRLQSWYGDEGVNYSYSGISLDRNNWSDTLLKIKKEVESQLGERFNSCLCNLYRDGNDYVSWHSDDEVELGSNPIIACVSFGQERRMTFMHKHNKGIEKVVHDLSSKSLLVMKGKLQHNWKHQINKTAKKVGPRISLTFRTILSS